MERLDLKDLSLSQKLILIFLAISFKIESSSPNTSTNMLPVAVVDSNPILFNCAETIGIGVRLSSCIPDLAAEF